MVIAVQDLDEVLVDALASFLVTLPGDDQTFLGAPIGSVAAAERAAGRWARQPPGYNRVAVDDTGAVQGFVSVEPGPAWSAHVGRLRLVVAPAARGRGLGRRLALEGLQAALAASLAKVVVEVRSDQQAVIGLFASLGFQPEALLADHIRTPEGTYYDLITLAHRAEDVQALFAAVGPPEGAS